MEVRNINNAENTALKGIAGSRIYGGTDNFAYSINFRGNITKTAQNGLIWVANNFSSPHQRAILGVTALCTQPFIDLHNRHIKKEDKPITVAKTISKIIVGTIAGVTLRHYAIKAADKFTQTVKTGKYSQCLLHKGLIEELKKTINKTNEYLLNSVRNYKEGLGTFLGVATGAFTNFLIDAPLTKYLTNFIHDNCFKKEDANEH